jgi:hypothetical protein
MIRQFRLTRRVIVDELRFKIGRRRSVNRVYASDGPNAGGYRRESKMRPVLDWQSFGFLCSLCGCERVRLPISVYKIRGELAYHSDAHSCNEEGRWEKQRI